MGVCCARILVLLSIVVSAMPAWSQDDFITTKTRVYVPGNEPREHVVDHQRMDLNVEFEPEKGLVKGRVEHHFVVLRETVDSIEYDAVGITIKQCTINGLPARFVSTDTSVIVYCLPALKWDATGTVAFTYEATPSKGIYFIGWNDPTGRMRKQIWTQGQGIDNRHWIPMYDEMNDKLITSVRATFDSAYTVVSNGLLETSTNNGNGTTTWQYTISKPHAPYLVMLAIGEYGKEVVKGANGVPIELYYYPDRADQIADTYAHMAASMDFLERELGVPYPWKIYRNIPVADFIFGAMENTTSTIFGDFYLTNKRESLDRSYVGTNIHELTHQWFGDLITARSKTHHWLQESFATFYPHLFSLYNEGVDEYEWSRRTMQERSLEAGKADRKPIVHPNAGTARYYPKGACVIDMMRSTFGADATRRVITHYLKKHAYANVETNDLFLAFQDVLGLTPHWFFEQWLYQGGEPNFVIDVRSASSTAAAGDVTETIVTVSQTHATDNLTGYFRVKAGVEVYYDDSSVDSVTAWIDGAVTDISIPNPAGKTVSFVVFDPGGTILKTTQMNKLPEQLFAQARRARHMIDRYDALLALENVTGFDMDILDIIEHVQQNEQHYAMRQQAAKLATLLADRGVTHAFKTVEGGLRDKHAEVRKSTLRAQTTISARLKPLVVEMLTDESYEVISIALRKLTEEFPEETYTFLKACNAVKSPFARVETERLIARVHVGDSTAMRELADLAGPSFEFWTRGNAMKAFARLGHVTPDGALAMIDAMGSKNTRLASQAEGVVKELATQTRWKMLFKTIAGQQKLEPSHKKAVEALLQ